MPKWYTSFVLYFLLELASFLLAYFSLYLFALLFLVSISVYLLKYIISNMAIFEACDIIIITLDTSYNLFH